MWGHSNNAAYLREVELAIVNAPFGGDWTGALDQLARACRSRGTNLVSIGGPVPSLNILTGYDTGLFAESFADPAMWGEGNWRVGTATIPFQIQHDGHYADYRARHPTSRYDEVVHGLGMSFGCQTIFAQDETGFLGLALMRTEREGPCSPEVLASFERLCRVTARAIKVEASLAGEGAILALGQMDSVGKAVILLNRHGWRCAVSAEAEAVLVAGWPLQSSRERIRLSDRAGDYRFQQQLSFLLSAPPTAMLTASMRTAGWRIEMTQLPFPCGELAFEAVLALTVTPDP